MRAVRVAYRFGRCGPPASLSSGVSYHAKHIFSPSSAQTATAFYSLRGWAGRCLVSNLGQKSGKRTRSPWCRAAIGSACFNCDVVAFPALDFPQDVAPGNFGRLLRHPFLWRVGSLFSHLQLLDMIGIANKITSLDAGRRLCLHSRRHCPGASEFNR